MSKPNWNHRLHETTRGRIVALLRRDDATVNELAEALKLTDNAIRTHLSALERDGLVKQRGMRRGMGAPAFVYGLMPAADSLLSKAYALVLSLLLDVFAEQTEPDVLEARLREAGRRLAVGRTIPGENLRARVDAAVGLLGELGGVAEVEEAEKRLYIRGVSCPLSAVAAKHPEVCVLAEAFLTEVIGVPVQEHCDRGERPRCCFEVTPVVEAGLSST
jgi:predicted ArsR family transcriptional regulator